MQKSVKWLELIWTDEQVKYLIDNYKCTNDSINEIAEHLGKTYRAVQLKASKLGITKKRNKFNEEHLKFVSENYLTMSDGKIAEHLGLSERTIRDQRNKHGFTKESKYSPSPAVKWSEEETQYLIDNYHTKTYYEMAKFLGRSRKSLERKAINLNLGLKGGTYMRGKSSTYIEDFVENILMGLKVNYIREKRIGTFYVDFFIPGLKLCIEVQGDYWHCNPKVFNKPLNKIHLRAIERDKRKKDLVTSKGFELLEIWEYDINKSPKEVTKLLTDILALPPNHVNCGKPLKKRKLKRKVKA